MNRNTTAAVLALLLTAGPPAQAAPLPVPAPDGGAPLASQHPALTLAQAVRLAIARDPRGQIWNARGQEADALGRQAGSPLAGNPALSLRHQTDRWGSRIGLREWEAGVELPLWRPGQRQARQDLAQSSAGYATAGREALALEVAGRVREAVWNVAMARNELAMAEQEWRLSRELEHTVERRVSLGDLARSDLVLAREETLRRQETTLTAQAEVAHARRRYLMLTGLEAVPTAAEQRAPASEIEDSHPLLAERLAQLQRAEYAATVARRERADSPQLLLGARQERGSFTDSAVNSVGVTLRLPIGIASQSAPRIAAAEVAVAEARSRLEQQRRDLGARLHEAEHSLDVIGKRLVLARQQESLAKENLRMARLAFASGESDLTSLLRVQALAFAAERNLTGLNISQQRAVARYNQTVGARP